jgi:hypothetical protein
MEVTVEKRMGLLSKNSPDLDTKKEFLGHLRKNLQTDFQVMGIIQGRNRIYSLLQKNTSRV